MILIMARRMKARDFRARHSKSFAKRRLRLIQASARSVPDLIRDPTLGLDDEPLVGRQPLDDLDPQLPVRSN